MDSTFKFSEYQNDTLPCSEIEKFFFSIDRVCAKHKIGFEIKKDGCCYECGDPFVRLVRYADSEFVENLPDHLHKAAENIPAIKKARRRLKTIAAEREKKQNEENAKWRAETAAQIAAETEVRERKQLQVLIDEGFVSFGKHYKVVEA